MGPFTFATAQPIFPNLRSFECFCPDTWTHRHLTIQLVNKGLYRLTMPYMCSRLFPPVDQFPRLNSLRLFLSPKFTLDDFPGCSCGNCIYPHTSLAQGIHTTISRLSVEQSFKAQWPASIWKTLEFPNLRVLNLQGLGETCVYPVYSFVQRHSTLLEVNLAFQDTALRLEGLIKLIEGTGRWVVPDGVAPTAQLLLSGSKDVPDAAEVVSFQQRYLKFSDDIPDTCVIFPGFAFIREPITSDAKEWRSPKASSVPRYKPIAIAFRIPDKRQFDNSDVANGESLKLSNIDDLLGLSRYFPGLKELRVGSLTICPCESDFISLTVSRISILRGLRPS